MKKQIRRGVFETNSSSTHSLQINNRTLQEALDDVNDRIRDAYSNSDDKVFFNESDYFQGNSIILKGLEFESGCEESNIYYIISNPIAKIQYLFMLLYSKRYYIKGYDKTKYSYSLKEDPKLVTETSTYKRFVIIVLEYLQTHGYPEIWDTSYEPEYEEYCGDNLETSLSIPDILEINEITPDIIENLFSEVMKPECIITFADEAYSPYEKPEIYTL